MSDPILTAKVGTNADQFPDILKMYVPAPANILDMTYGNGVFWKNIDIESTLGYTIFANDINPEKGEHHYDFRIISQFVTQEFDAVVFDPPYIFGAGGKDMLDKQYGNNPYREQGSPGPSAVVDLFACGIIEAKCLLKNDGVVIVKCMDFISGGVQRRVSIQIREEAIKLGLIDEDLFVMVQSTPPIMRHSYQLHARKNHSYWWVFRKHE